MKQSLLVLVALLFVSGCGPSYYIHKTVAEYDQVKSQVKLGNTKEQVVSILEPTQIHLRDKSWKKRADRFIHDNVLVEILYFRSGLQSDGLTTDDEFTPYIFYDGILKGIGWEMISGDFRKIIGFEG